MINTVIKRDGRKVSYDNSKILNAIQKAFEDVDGEFNEKSKALTKGIAEFIGDRSKEEMSVEEIQDLIEQKLMQSSRKDVAKAYILYRNDRSRIRHRNSKIMRDVIKKLSASDVQNQNANVDEKSFGGKMGEAIEVITKDYALNYIVSDTARQNHINNEIYIHDLGHYALGDHNCLSIPFDDLLKNGFNTKQTDVRGAQSVSTAFQLVAVIFQLQSLQQFGKILCRIKTL